VGEVHWLDGREQRAWRALQFMSMRLNARLARELSAESDLSGADYGVLVALTDQPDGRMRAFELARHLGWEPSRVSHHTTRMAKRGLVTKKRDCPTDRRGAFVVLTPKGRQAIEAAAPSHVRSVRRLFVDRLTPQQLDAIGEAAEAILAVLDQECAREDGDV
jgi:DNA-binding MarR family transcriptional regulator